jgi:hypothetical protein
VQLHRIVVEGELAFGDRTHEDNTAAGAVVLVA